MIATGEPKAFQDIETGMIYEIYPIPDGTKITFNLDGIPFKFENFIFISARIEDVVQAIYIHAPKLSTENLLKINGFLNLPPKGENEDPLSKEELAELEEWDVRFQIKEEAINQFINPKFSMIRNITQLFSLRDDIGGSVILDFYYYDIILLEPPYVEIINPEEEEDQ